MKYLISISFLIGFQFKLDRCFASALPVAATPIEISGRPAKFDFMAADSSLDRILAAHKQAESLTVLDAKSGKLLPEVKVGHVQGIGIDISLGLYVLGDEDEKKVVILDAKSLQVFGEIRVPGPVDSVVVNSKSHMAYADEDGGKRVWVIDLQSKKLVSTISIPGVPEVIEYDRKTDRIYQNIKDKDSIAVIDPSSNQVIATWSTLPASGPHGLVIDSEAGEAFIAGHNGKLISLDLKTGKVLSVADISPGPDQIALDSKAKKIYCASKAFISVVDFSASGLRNIGNIPTHTGAHTIAVDPARHDIWIVYADEKHSFIQKFETSK